MESRICSCTAPLTRSDIYAAYVSVMFSGQQKRRDAPWYRAGGGVGRGVWEMSRGGGKVSRIELVGRWSDHFRCSEEEWEREWISKFISNRSYNSLVQTASKGG
jgi:hypothetical protein